MKTKNLKFTGYRVWRPLCFRRLLVYAIFGVQVPLNVAMAEQTVEVPAAEMLRAIKQVGFSDYKVLHQPPNIKCVVYYYPSSSRSDVQVSASWLAYAFPAPHSRPARSCHIRLLGKLLKNNWKMLDVRINSKSCQKRDVISGKFSPSRMRVDNRRLNISKKSPDPRNTRFDVVIDAQGEGCTLMIRSFRLRGPDGSDWFRDGVKG